MPGARHELRTGYASWLRERSARHAAPIKISPPPVTDNRSGSAQLIIIEAGCLICGVATSHACRRGGPAGPDERRSSDLEAVATFATQLGARSSLEVSGFVCRICADAVEHVHSVGPSALERSLTSYLCPDLTSKLDGWNQVTMSGLAGWSTLVARAHRGIVRSARPRPNAKPWEHLGDLERGSQAAPAAAGRGRGPGRRPSGDHDQNREVNAAFNAPIPSPADTPNLAPRRAPGAADPVGTALAGSTRARPSLRLGVRWG